MNLINICGLILNFTGTILIVFYICTDNKECIENEEGQKPGEKWHAIYVKHPRWLLAGVILIAVGFALSIIAEIIEERNNWTDEKNLVGAPVFADTKFSSGKK